MENPLIEIAAFLVQQPKVTIHQVNTWNNLDPLNSYLFRLLFQDDVQGIMRKAAQNNRSTSKNNTQQVIQKRISPTSWSISITNKR